MSSFNDYQRAVDDAEHVKTMKELKHYKQALETIKVLAEVKARKDSSHQDYVDFVSTALSRGTKISEEDLDKEVIDQQYHWYQTGDDPWDDEECESEGDLNPEEQQEEVGLKFGKRYEKPGEESIWIKTSDKLPDAWQCVWYFSDEVGIHNGRYYDLTSEGKHIFAGLNGALIGDATHWTPRYSPNKEPTPKPKRPLI